MRETGYGRMAAVWLGLALAIAACDDDDGGNDRDPPEAVTLPCDIRERSCQRAVFAETARLRTQTGAKLPPIRVITRDQYAAETRQQVSEATVTREGEILQGVLRMLEFLPAGSSVSQAAADNSIEGVAAYYHKRDQTVTIIEDAAKNPSSGTFTLSHEFVHALQDQRENLTTLDAMGKNADSQLAIDCLVEGEAVVISYMLLAQLRDGGAGTTSLGPYFERMLTAFIDDIAMSTSPLQLSLMTLAYPVGGHPLADAYQRDGVVGLQGFYRQRPLTMVSWVDGDRTLPTALRCGIPTAPPGYELYGLDRLGGAGLLSLHTRLGKTGAEAFEATRAWTNDSFAIFATPAGTPVASAFTWRISLRDAVAAAELETAVRAKALPQLDVLRTDSDVLVSGATDPALLASWTSRADCVVAKSRADEPTQRLFVGPFGDRVYQQAHRH